MADEVGNGRALPDSLDERKSIDCSLRVYDPGSPRAYPPRQRAHRTLDPMPEKQRVARNAPYLQLLSAETATVQPPASPQNRVELRRRLSLHAL